MPGWFTFEPGNLLGAFRYASYVSSIEPTLNPVCPGCGYDQSGEIATWKDQCPIGGRCVECGSAFGWREVYQILGEWGSEVDWYSEHAGGVLGLVKRTPGTIARLIYPAVFFRKINHRRAINLKMLVYWLVLVYTLIHLLVSPIGVLAIHAEEYQYLSSEFSEPWWRVIDDPLLDVLNSVLFPYTHLSNSDSGLLINPLFDGFEWKTYSLLAFVGVGVMLSWILLMSVVFFLGSRWDNAWKRQCLLLGRISLLSLLPMLVHLEIVRFGFGLYVINGMGYETNWIPWMFVLSALVMILWQQVIWTHAVRRIWEIKRSWLINIGGCFGTFIGGIVFALLIIA